MKLLSLFTFILFLFLTEGALKFCPRNRCLPLRLCPSMMTAIRSRLPHLLQLARSSICGYQGARAKVCCNDPETQQRVVAPRHPPARRPCHQDQHGNQDCRVPGSNHALLPQICGLVVSSRIYGGTHTELGAYPWIVAMKYTRAADNVSNIFCSGTLISKRYVVTAAHCLDGNTTKGWTLSSVVLGEWQLSTDPDCVGQGCAPPVVEVGIEKVLLHPGYNKEYGLVDDVGLVRLDTIVNYTRFIQPLCLPPIVLPPAEVALGVSVQALGWGQWEAGDMSDILRRVTLNITNPWQCLHHFPTHFRINRAQLCLGGSGGVDTCSGDSGGPVINLGSSGRLYLLGLPSFGKKNCGEEAIPAVYTSLAHYTSWIRGALSP